MLICIAQSDNSALLYIDDSDFVAGKSGSDDELE